MWIRKKTAKIVTLLQIRRKQPPRPPPHPHPPTPTHTRRTPPTHTHTHAHTDTSSQRERERERERGRERELCKICQRVLKWYYIVLYCIVTAPCHDGGGGNHCVSAVLHERVWITEVWTWTQTSLHHLCWGQVLLHPLNSTWPVIKSVTCHQIRDHCDSTNHQSQKTSITVIQPTTCH